ncbi:MULTISPECIES: hypothetical protein [unclassified Kitasatospora]
MVLLSFEDMTRKQLFAGTAPPWAGLDYGGLMAGATLTALPVVVAFLLVQRRIAAGLATGAIRG